MTRIETGPGWELRLGRWQDVLSDVKCDALITDPPYGARTHAKQFHGRRKCSATSDKWATTRGIEYKAIDSGDVSELAKLAPVDGWCVAFTSHDLVPAHTEHLEALGRYVFAPLPVVMRGMNVRLAGDGPSSWCVWCVVSRPRSGRCVKWGTLPGAYVGNPFDVGANTRTDVRNAANGGFPGIKPLWLMRAIVRDYSRPGDLVCDPYAGSGTTLLAAVMEGRRAIGAEMDEGRFEIALKRLRGGYTPQMFT